jgi:predicted permease
MPYLLVERLLRQTRFAVRSYLKTPGLTITILITLALGLGASLASFSLVDALLLRQIGAARPDELVRIAAAASDGEELLPITSTMRESIARLPAFAGVCGLNTPGRVVRVGDRMEIESLLHVSGDCFNVLGVTARLGRLLTAEDDRAANPVVVATYDFWQRALGGTADVLGRTVEIEGRPYTIVGVAEQAFRGLSTIFPAALVVPINTARGGAAASGPYWNEVVARLARGVSIEQARAQFDAVWPALKADVGVRGKSPASVPTRFATTRPFVGGISTGLDNVRRPLFGQPLLLTLGLSVVMLGICGANVANLLAARALTRRREQAMRLALGASRGDLLSQSVIEALLPVASGALLAVPLADVVATSLVGLLQASYIGLDVAVAWDRHGGLFLVCAVVLLTMLVWFVQRAGDGTRGGQSLAEALHASARSSGASRRGRRQLVAAQIALTVLLVCGAGAFGRTLLQYYSVDPGFIVDAGLAASLRPLPGGAGRPGGGNEGGAYYDDLLQRIGAIPGVRAASLTTWVPMGGPSTGEEVERIPAVPEATAAAVSWLVSDRFFESAGIALKEGRTFTRMPALADTATVAAVRSAILSESLAKRLFPHGGAVGGRVRYGSDPRRQDLPHHRCRVGRAARQAARRADADPLSQLLGGCACAAVADSARARDRRTSRTPHRRRRGGRARGRTGISAVDQNDRRAAWDGVVARAPAGGNVRDVRPRGTRDCRRRALRPLEPLRREPAHGDWHPARHRCGRPRHHASVDW